ncbi:MAG: NAD(P)(+) transhydrogenase (Re/Si-specific) subunit beta [Paracoccaceae bacterium]
MDFGFTTAAYVVAAVLFIFSLGGLSGQESAKRAVWYGIVGMAIAVVATLIGPGTGLSLLSIVLIALGGIVGHQLATRVEMTQMPELVAIMHSLVGLAAVFVGFNADIEIARVGNIFADAGLAFPAVAKDLASGAEAVAADLVARGAVMDELGAFASLIAKKTAVEITILRVELVLGIWIGAVTFTGSVIAYGKLAGKVDSAAKQMQLPNEENPIGLISGHALNAIAAALSVILLIMYLSGAGSWTLVLLTIAALFIGYHLIMGIGGADMPVVVSMLNSYSGWAAAAIGFSLGNDLLIVVGALVGSSGAILSYIMCKAMNRSFVSVILGGFGGGGGEQMAVEGEQIAIDADGVAAALNDADSVVIIPGYGMAVAQAQQAVSEMTKKLRAAGKEVRFAIHPVAGRLPGHMNVLLAEAKVPYDIVLEMDEINDDFPDTDVAIIIGSNDIVNPAAQDDPNSPIAGMPVLEVWKAKQVFVSKRGQGTGYSGIENPLFYKENTRMFYGDAKASVDSLLPKLE